MQRQREVFCGSQVKQILIEGEGDAARAVGVKLADGRVFRGRTVVSNATRWDTFENLLGEQDMPEAEQLFRCLLLCHQAASSDTPIHGKAVVYHTSPLRLKCSWPVNNLIAHYVKVLLRRLLTMLTGGLCVQEAVQKVAIIPVDPHGRACGRASKRNTVPPYHCGGLGAHGGPPGHPLCVDPHPAGPLPVPGGHPYRPHLLTGLDR